LPEELTRSFAKYQEKDILAILTTKGKRPTALPTVLAPLTTSGTQIYTLKSVVAPDQNPAAPLEADTIDSSSDATVEHAVLKLQKFWRKRRPYLHSYRVTLKTPGGKATAFIFDIIRPNSGERHTLGRVRKAVVLLTDAKQFLVDCWLLRDNTGAAHVLSDSVLSNPKISTQALDELVSSPLLKELEEIRAEFEKGGSMREIVEEAKVKRLFEDQKKGYRELKAFFVSSRRDVLAMGRRLDRIVKRLKEMEKGGL
jgi:hypothetical protein